VERQPPPRGRAGLTKARRAATQGRQSHRCLGGRPVVAWSKASQRKGGRLNTYVILRRGGWRSADTYSEASDRALSAVERISDDVRWIRSYVLAELDGSVGTVCVYRATSPEAIRAHADAADLPIDEIVAVTETVVVRPDGSRPQPDPENEEER
jgi:Protein of unknown function (DUF4242)